MRQYSFKNILRHLSNRYGLASVAVVSIFTLAGFVFIGNGVYSYTLQTKVAEVSTTPRPAPALPSATQNGAKTMLGYSEPRTISIPAISVEADIMKVGKNEDGTLEVPKDDNVTKAGWYKHSPSPGQIGGSVIAGHVNLPDGSPNIFFRLGELNIGDGIAIIRQDGTKAEFEVTSKNTYLKETFPSASIYTSSSSTPTLQLITCGGEYDGVAQDYDSNIVVTATMRQ